MTTDEERREVARYLREAANGHGWLDVDVCHALDRIGGYGEKSPVELLADLIEPQERTCKIGMFEAIEYGEFSQIIGYAYHLTCGHIVVRPYIRQCKCERPKYCDECGARITEVD